MSSRILLDEIEAQVAEKNLRKAIHPYKPLAIYNYSEQVQYKKAWTPLLLECRGLVVDLETGNVVAKPMTKFFNWSEQQHTVPSDNESFDVMEKVDGSLGQLFWYDNEWIFTSRGSFQSDQAAQGMKLAAGLLEHLDKAFTYIFEIIYPENRIVVNYGTRRELILLAVTTKTEDLPFSKVQEIARQLNVACVKTIEPLSPEELRKKDLPNEEGYVLRFRSTGERVKIKFDNYVDLHRVVTNFSLKHVKEWFLEDPSIDISEKLDMIPDEFFEEVKVYWKELHKLYQNEVTTMCTKIKDNIDIDFSAVDAGPHRSLVCKALRLIRREGFDYDTTISQISHEWAIVKIKENVKDIKTFLTQSVSSMPRKSTLLLLCGPSGSGKSTFAKAHCNRLGKDSIIISRDLIRQSLCSPPAEVLVSKIQHVMIKTAIRDGMRIIIDNTNLKTASIKEFYQRYHNQVQEIRVKLFDVDLDTCVSRVMKRSYHHVPTEVIQEQFVKFQSIKTQRCWDNFAVEYPCGGGQKDQLLSKKVDCLKPRVIIFDCDGTLMLNRSGRSPYDETRVLQDVPNEPIVDVYHSLVNDYTMIICTGRTEACRTDTERWLARHGILYWKLYMRQIGDTRKDHVVKEDMWNKIQENYSIEMMFDDRASVVDHARSLGYTVAQVDDGLF